MMIEEGQYPIDAVITWVDGDDPIHRAKREAYITDKKENQHIDVAGETRYRQVGEIAYCVASINRFAPWIRKIFIVTDNQSPDIKDFMDRNFPDKQIPIEIVDHKVIFKGYEQYLPTFNSRAIESFIYRIPKLSEHYVYFNDDLFLLRPMRPSDFFQNESPIANGYWHLTWTARLLRLLRRKKNGHKTVSFRDSMMNAAKVLNSSRFIRIVHTPHAFRRSVFEQIYLEYPRLFESNIIHRFRNENQYNVTALFYCYSIPKKLSVLSDKKNHYLYLSPGHSTLDEVKNVLIDFENNEDAMFCCFNSMDMASQEIIEEMELWIKKRLNIK